MSNKHQCERFPPATLTRRRSAVARPHIVTSPHHVTSPSPSHQPQVVTIVTGAGGFQVSENPSSTAWSRGPPSTARGGRLPRRRRQESLGSGVVVVVDPLTPPAAWGKVAAGKHCTLLFPKASIPSSAGVQECLLNIDTTKVQVLSEVNVLHIQQGRKLPFHKGTGSILFCCCYPCRF